MSFTPAVSAAGSACCFFCRAMRWHLDNRAGVFRQCGSREKQAAKAKAASGLAVSVHPGSPLAESGLVCRDLHGRSFIIAVPSGHAFYKAGTVPVWENPMKTGVRDKSFRGAARERSFIMQMRCAVFLFAGF
ncbi:hypothetical protein OIU34_14025 [Pararhizobium sp. BT-229]|uniref:hypothetical protein n=1 Tax=Pararhizobium sp. BT-229 TaxID=2986923 RepID=UPI0021F6DE82|nr:hypothetical protein [Pararhizobium sp. BT-229]MCV9963022.1 hypothetical protein [Pararhizobium sp. BT-229]